MGQLFVLVPLLSIFEFFFLGCSQNVLLVSCVEDKCLSAVILGVRLGGEAGDVSILISPWFWAQFPCP